MDKGNLNIEQPEIPDDDSNYLDNEDSGSQLDLSGLFSNQFVNVKPLYSSPTGPTELFVATRYSKRHVLKGLKSSYRNDPFYVLALTKEFEIGIQLDHPNIRRTLAFEEIDNIGKVIILEYIDGSSLESIIKSKDLSLEEGRSISEQVAQALGYLHSRQIFHRDLKPSNILITYSGSIAKIIDFNLSDSEEFIVLKNPAGSRRYMAPEQLNGGAKPSVLTDIYSLGVVMSEIAAITGDEELAEVAKKCANPQPEKRPQSISKIKIPSSNPSWKHLLSHYLSSKVLTYIMMCICLTLAGIVILLLNSNK